MNKNKKIPLIKTISPWLIPFILLGAFAFVASRYYDYARFNDIGDTFVILMPLIILLHLVRWIIARKGKIYYRLYISRFSFIGALNPNGSFNKQHTINDDMSKKELVLYKDYGLKPPIGPSQNFMWFVWTGAVWLAWAALYLPIYFS